MTLKQMQEYRKEFGSISTGDLLAIAEENDLDKYSAEELQAIHRILVEKGAHLRVIPFELAEDAVNHSQEEACNEYESDPPPGSKTWGYQTQPRARHHFRHYRDVRWYRRSGWNVGFMLVHILTGGFVPLLLCVCLNLVSGDVYYKTKEHQGYLKTWGLRTKILTGVLLVISFVWFAFAFKYLFHWSFKLPAKLGM